MTTPAWVYVATHTGHCIHLARANALHTLCHARMAYIVPKPTAFETCLICQSKARKLDADSAPLKLSVARWLEFFDRVRTARGDEIADLTQDAYLLGRKVGFHEGRDDARQAAQFRSPSAPPSMWQCPTCGGPLTADGRYPDPYCRACEAVGL